MTDTRPLSGPVRIAPSRPGRLRRLARSAAGGLLYSTALIPLSVATLAAVPFGGARAAAAKWLTLRARLLGRAPIASWQPGTARVCYHAVIGVLLGVAALAAIGIVVLMVARGLLYGIVVPGPYTDSWGGPSRAGAWLVHFLIGTPIAVAALAGLAGVAALHDRMTESLGGARPARWVTPVTVLVFSSMTVFIVLWSHQI